MQQIKPQEKGKVYIEMKMAMIIAIIVLVPLLGWGMQVTASKIFKVTCSGLSKHQAQIIFHSDPVFFKSLDKDHDGIACEKNI